MNHPLASFIKRFFSHYLPVQKGLSVNTILAYRDAVKYTLANSVTPMRANSFHHNITTQKNICIFPPRGNPVNGESCNLFSPFHRLDNPGRKLPKG